MRRIGEPTSVFRPVPWLFIFSMAMVSALVVLGLEDGFYVADLSPGVIQKWIAVALAYVAWLILAQVLRDFSTAAAFVMPIFVGLNFTLFSLLVPEEDFLARNQIGYRPWILIFDVLLPIPFVAAVIESKRGHFRQFVSAALAPTFAYALFLCAGIVSALFAHDVAYGFIGVIALGKFLLWYWAFILLVASDRSRLNYLVWGLAVFVLTQGVLGFLQAMGIHTIEALFGWSADKFQAPSGVLRVGGTLGRATLESMLLLVIPLLYAFASYSLSRGLQKSLMWAIAIFGTLLIFLTGSRGPSLSVLVGTLVALQAIPFHRITKRHVIYGILVLILLFVGSLVIISAGNLQDTLLRNTYDFRFAAYALALKMFLSKPLLGVGLNNYLVVGPQYGMSLTEIIFGRPVHNQFLLVAAEMGIVGMSTFLLSLSVWWRSISVALKRNFGDPSALGFLHGARGAFVAFFVASMLDAPLIKGPVIAPVGILLAGVSIFTVAAKTRDA